MDERLLVELQTFIEWLLDELYQLLRTTIRVACCLIRLNVNFHGNTECMVDHPKYIFTAHFEIGSGIRHYTSLTIVFVLYLSPRTRDRVDLSIVQVHATSYTILIG